MPTMLSHKNFFPGNADPLSNFLSHNLSQQITQHAIPAQFVETGCENCDFLSMENSSERVLEVCITSYLMTIQLHFITLIRNLLAMS